MGFNYTDIVSKGCEGWLNLFFGDNCIAMISDVALANKIMAKTKNRKKLEINVIVFDNLISTRTNETLTIDKKGSSNEI